MNRLELVGDRGSITCEGETIELATSSQSVDEHCRTTSEMFGMPEFEQQTLSNFATVNQHAAVLENFVAAIADGAALLTPGTEGLGSLQLANAMLLSAWTDARVQLPVDGAAYEAALQQRINASSLREPDNIEVKIDMDASYR